LFKEMGCEVISLFDQPDGYNINQQCGSTYPETMCQKVIDVGADIGFALDGDADRLIACDASGQIVDGDKVIAILAEHLLKQGKLKGQAVVTTLMSNMGLAKFLEQRDVQMLRANVGDRYVLEMMRDKGCNLGGEQSGHMILLDNNTTGDGLMTALQLLCAMQETKQPLSELAKDLTLYPQKLWNIVMEKKVDVLSDASVQTLIQHAEQSLGNTGRVNVRASGTEPKLRVMIEAESEALMLDVGNRLVEELSVTIKTLM